MGELTGRTVLMSGGSRGIGLAVAIRLAKEGANIAIVAKTDQPHPTLEGTIHTAADEIREAGGQALPILGDVRDEEQVAHAAARTVDAFGGIDIVVNNASAINLAPMEQLDVKRYDLMQSINSRGTFVFTKAALPHLRQSDHAHVLTMSPPLSTEPKWLRNHSAYTLSKFGMTMITLGVAVDEHDNGIAANCLWPRTLIGTAAVRNLLGGPEMVARARSPQIMADAAFEILQRKPADCTGNTFLDDEVLRDLARPPVHDLSGYAAPDAELALDLFVDGWPEDA
ncbi:MAG: SDR family oxidoreductase [Baekduiaceae bacterium]